MMISRWLLVIFAAFLIAGTVSRSAYVTFSVLFGGLLSLIIVKVASWLTERQRRRALLADCDYEHAHATHPAGDEQIAIYGRYRPWSPALPGSFVNRSDSEQNLHQAR